MSAVRFLVAIILAALDLRLVLLIARRIGWTGTLAWLLGACLLGLSLLRASRGELAKLPRSGDLDLRGGETLARAAGFGIAGVLLVIPGLLSDIAAILLLVPAIRWGLLRTFFRSAAIDPFESMTYGRRHEERARPGDSAGVDRGKGPFPGEVRDVEFEMVDDSPPDPRGPQEGRGDVTR